MMNKRMKVCAQRRFQHNVKRDSEYLYFFVPVVENITHIKAEDYS